MPRELEQALMRTYEKRKKKGKLKGVDKDRYVFGGLRATGWKPSREK